MNIKWKQIWSALERIHRMQLSHTELQSHSKAAARKVGVTGSISVCDVNNDRILHWQVLHAFGITAQQAKWSPDPGAYTYLMDHWNWLSEPLDSKCWTAYWKTALPTPKFRDIRKGGGREQWHTLSITLILFLNKPWGRMLTEKTTLLF